MKDYKNLIVWQKAHELSLSIYKMTEKFPYEEKYGLTSQLRRSSVSVPANISEGCGHQSKKEFVRFLQIASGSASEMEYLIILCKDLCYLSHEEYEKLFQIIVEVKKMLRSLIERSKPTNSKQLIANV
ncbi:MAG TPA: four helix bundle protein [Bacteroidia bacterium]|jgi:four helix bundle protein|nr:four helix bundle protein [Bacteroidia bacterium]